MLVLVRQQANNATHRKLKIRHSGKDGIHFSEEEVYLEEDLERLFALLQGKVIRC